MHSRRIVPQDIRQAGAADDHDITVLREANDAPVYDDMRTKHMQPLDHADWALRLPAIAEPQPLTPVLATAAKEECNCSEQQMHERREHQLSFWLQRKKELEEPWRLHLATLPPHVQDVLGSNKNLYLLKARAPAVLGAPIAERILP